MGGIGLALAYVFNIWGFLIDDPMFRLVIMVQSATPTMVNLIAISIIHGKFEREMGSVLFYKWVLIMSRFLCVDR